MHKLKEICRGWLNYFSIASIVGKLKDLESRVSDRLKVSPKLNRPLALIKNYITGNYRYQL
jgi:hypothetical protein